MDSNAEQDKSQSARRYCRSFSTRLSEKPAKYTNEEITVKEESSSL